MTALAADLLMPSATDKPNPPGRSQTDNPVAPKSKLSATATSQKLELRCPAREVGGKSVFAIALTRFSPVDGRVHGDSLENPLVVPELRGRGNPHPGANSGTILDIDEGFARLGATTPVRRWRARRSGRVVSPVGWPCRKPSLRLVS